MASTTRPFLRASNAPNAEAGPDSARGSSQKRLELNSLELLLVKKTEEVKKFSYTSLFMSQHP